MKKALCILITVIFSTLFVNSVAEAQVKISLNVPVWDVTAACPPIWTAYATISIIESYNTDFYGTPGAGNRTKFDLRIALPPGWTFDKWAPSTWRVDKSSNLQNGSGVITYQWVNVDQILNTQFGTPDVDLWPDVAPDTSMANTITLTGLECKNQNGDVDELILSNIRIKLIPMVGQGDPSGDFYAWTENVQFGPPSGPVVNNLPMIGTSSTLPVVNYQPGNAEGIVFVVQPKTEVLHDVQQRIKGADWTSQAPVWPTIAAIDCNGYKTTKLPTPAPSVNLILIDAVSNFPINSNPSWWMGSGPTYGGSVTTSTPTSAWSNGEIPLVFSVMDSRSIQSVGNFHVEATATGLYTPTQWGIDNGVSNIAMSADDSPFKVRKRIIGYLEGPTFPEFGYKATDHNMFIPLYGDTPETTVPMAVVHGLDGLLSTDQDPVSLNLLGPGVSTLPTIIEPGRYLETEEADMAGEVTFDGNSPDPGPGFYITNEEIDDPLAFNAFIYVGTLYYGSSTTPGTETYLDPRYIIPVAVPIDITPLPVELTAFGGQMRNEVVTLKWTTATESNNYGFDVERSFDRATWTKVGFVQGNGTTSSQHDYRFEDRLATADLQNAAISYRLRQIDRDGTTEYSQVVTLSVTPTAEKVTMLQNYPNPFNPTTNISFYLPASDVVTLIVYNELGVEVARVHDNAALESGWHTTSFRAGSLPSGLYAYRLQTGTGSVARTMVVAK